VVLADARRSSQCKVALTRVVECKDEDDDERGAMRETLALTRRIGHN
jgi:hypothetical protein